MISFHKLWKIFVMFMLVQVHLLLKCNSKSKVYYLGNIIKDNRKKKDIFMYSFLLFCFPFQASPNPEYTGSRTANLWDPRIGSCCWQREMCTVWRFWRWRKKIWESTPPTSAMQLVQLIPQPDWQFWVCIGIIKTYYIKSNVCSYSSLSLSLSFYNRSWGDHATG